MATFKSKSGVIVGTLELEQHRAMLHKLTGEYGVRWAQITEAAGYSFTMVIRYALGLSAAGGKVVAIAADSLAGWVTLAAARQLSNSGAEVSVLLLLDPEQASSEVEAQVTALQSAQVTCEHWSFFSEAQAFADLISGSHNVLNGMYGCAESDHDIAKAYGVILNEHSTPVHSVLCPLGLDPDSGMQTEGALISSSTLSLAAPLRGLHSGQENVGRHYLADISCPPQLYRELELEIGPVFAEQPVSQIFVVD